MPSGAAVRKGRGLPLGRGAVAAALPTLGALCLTGAAFGSSTISVVSLFGAGIAFGLGTANVYTIPQTLAGACAAGKWVALENGFGNAGGIVAPIVTGLIIDRTGQFFWAFLAAAAMAVLGMAGWGIVVKTVAPVQWKAGSNDLLL